MMRIAIAFALFALVAAVASGLACGSDEEGDFPHSLTATPNSPSADSGSSTGAVLADTARETLLFSLTSMFAVDDPTQIQLSDIKEVTWQDPCFGLADEGQCELTDDVLSGFRVVLSYGGDRFAFRMDNRPYPQVLFEGADGVPDWEAALVNYTKNELAEDRHLRADDVRVQSVQRAVWNDSCLGIEYPKIGGTETPQPPAPADGCLEPIGATAGVRVVLEVGGVEEIYRVSRSYAKLREK